MLEKYRGNIQTGFYASPFKNINVSSANLDTFTERPPIFNPLHKGLLHKVLAKQSMHKIKRVGDKGSLKRNRAEFD